MEDRLRTSHQRIKDGLRGRLIVPYQLQGVLWMLRREYSSMYAGGLLCDEMGLGKTIQTIATMIGNPQPTTLIVVPKAILMQWVNAFEKFMGETPRVITAANARLRDLRPEDVGGARVTITTYSTVGAFAADRKSADRAEAVPDRSPFHGVAFSRLICDEVHTIKNKTSKIFTEITKIRADVRWGLTGTPVTRNANDMTNLMGFLGVYSPSRVREMRGALVLRRTKEDVARITERLRLPPLEIRLATTPLRTAEEAALYRDVQEYGRLRLAAMHAEGASVDNMNLHMLEVILRLRQCVVNPRVLLEGLRRKQKDDDNDLIDAFGADETEWRHGCSKLELLGELIRSQQKREKTLIFCHWVDEMNAIQAMLKDEMGLVSVRLDGSMSMAERDAAVSSFSSSPDVNVFVIQIDCGGLGLNLQMATRVYINSLHWNAANELQAIGRTHRTGQTQKVVVTRLAVENTIDEYIIQKQHGKLKLAAEMLDDDRISDMLNDVRGSTTKLTSRDMMRIFEAVPLV